MRSIHITTANDLLDDIKRLQPYAVLSIEHPGAKDGEGRAPRLIDVNDKIIQRIQVYWDTEDPNIAKGPDHKHVMTGLSFLKGAFKKAKGRPIIIHCRSGKARSTAMALVFLVAVNPDKTIEECIAHLKQIRPIAAPNILVIKHGDTRLKKEGALLHAVETDPDFTRARVEANAARHRWVEKNPPAIIPVPGRRTRKLFPASV